MIRRASMRSFVAGAIPTIVLAVIFIAPAVGVMGLAPSAALAGPSRFDASDDAPFGFREAAHLFRRAGFGATPEQIDQLMRLGRDAAVDLLVDYDKIPIGDDPYPLKNSDTRPLERRLLGDLGEEERRQVTNALRRLNDRHMEAIRAWWVRRMIVTNRPLQEKMVLFWHGHFTSGYREVRSWRDMYRQNDFFRDHALGEFPDLLRGVSKDPAMVKYLDGARNVKASPNENYARELMELFSLGEGEYSETDIKEAARAFTGWGVDAEGFRFYPLRHDFGNKSFFGKRGRLDGGDIIDILVRHPSSSRFMARNLLEFFVYRSPSDDAVEELAKRVREHGFDFREVVRDLLRSDEFYSQEALFSQIKSPIDLVIGAARALEVESVNPHGLYNICRQMGQNLFQPPNVKGWDGDERWITTSTLFARYNFGKKLVQPGRRARATTRGGRMMAGDSKAGASSKGAAMMMVDDDLAMTPTIAEINPNVMATENYNPAPIVVRYELADADAVVDHYVRRLLQREIDPRRRDVLCKALSPANRPFRFDAPDAGRRIRDLIGLIMSMPEYQLY